MRALSPTLLVAALAATLVQTGCPESSAAGDAGAGDAGLAADAGHDAGGGGQMDGGLTDAGLADGGQTDGGQTDGGAVSDAGSQTDAGATDAGMSDGGMDAGPQGPGIFDNWSFENWTDGRPDGWFGDATNIQAWDQSTTDVRDGVLAIQLINTASGHKRFSSAPMSLEAGRYTCAYDVRGDGEIRTARLVDDDYSSYTSYASLTAGWERFSTAFTLQNDVTAFELIFSVRNTAAPEHVALDNVRCHREAEPCDTVMCGDHETCNNDTAQCEPNDGRCNVAADCASWQTCDVPSHTCVLADGACESTADCSGDTPVCDEAAHQCIPGDPCTGVTCEEWQACVPATGTCALADGRCVTTHDCDAPNPVCETETHLCQPATHAANLIPNGGFETWGVYDIPYEGEHLIPDAWYGLFGDTTDDTGATEIDPEDLVQVQTGAHSGLYALKMVQTGIAERFATEHFTAPGGTYRCSYWVRGEGGIRHRWYSKLGWGPQADRVDVATGGAWQRVDFTLPLASQAREFRLILYASYTAAAEGHLDIDDIVCSK